MNDEIIDRIRGTQLKQQFVNMEKILSTLPKYNLNDYTVVVFGTGNTSVLYQKCFELEGIKPVYYIDNNEAKQGTVFQSVPIISVEKLISLQKTFDKPVLVLICSAQIDVRNQIQSQLQKYGLTFTTVDSFVYGKNKDSINTVYDMLEDDFSKEVYAQIIHSSLNNISIPESLVSNEQYFILPQFSKSLKEEVFVDLGSYVGDTIEQYINKKSGVFKKIYAFEPYTVNFSALKCRTTRLKNEWAFSDDKLTLIYGGVGAKTESKYFTSLLQNEEKILDSAKIGANFIIEKTQDACEVMVYSLDDYFKEQKVCFIKADIESYELDMLHGAESVIKRDKPLLAICIYHNSSDMFTIPLLVKKLCRDYKLKIRHHSYGFLETVLYAY
jgi:FkbM family methyltransferase